MKHYKLLPALLAILQTRNLTQAAKQLHVTQSTMSKTLGQIRQIFADPILIREGNHFVLTRRGEQLEQELPSLLATLDNLLEPPKFDQISCNRAFVFASSDYVAQYILPIICQQVGRDAPRASVEFSAWHSRWLGQLSKHPFDVITTTTDEVPENLYGRKMAEDHSVILMRENHPLVNKNIDLYSYTNAQHILINAGGDKNTLVDKALNHLGKTRHVVTALPFFASAVSLLQHSDGILTVPLHIAANLSTQSNTVIRPLPFEVPPHQYYILWHAKHHQDPAHRWFRELCLYLSTQHLSSTINLGMKILHRYKS